ncbi:aldehyde dehydrogenase (NADP(+)) [Aureliella helgolandensis]|uniref:NADP-dependent fatty aldehyde dehydrogenase n=1 Tax=Aureliella helgolandensis TaxID=2527968 RepID=A0A518G5V5_9BACT|nr:aldehyde dehydrogenase (NADP(+)) [Aureliella helgolandensis]QDV23944.1 NADP-dependent fatty aldehyde dehydrogenase [Aureliella helgolandensis]
MPTTTPQTEKILVAGAWTASAAVRSFQSSNPATGEQLPQQYPVSSWDDCETLLDAAAEAAEHLQRSTPAEIAGFLEAFADLIDANNEELAAAASLETALPVAPRLAAVEIPRTSNQLRQAATAARNGSWAQATIDTKANIRSCYEPIGPVCVFGPNNFPFAFNSAAGGDFAAAIAAGNPVIAKANTSHPGITKKLAELALQAVLASGLHPATVQMIYRLSHADGARLVADHRVAAIGYTGSRKAGLTLKAAADQAGKPIYLELSSVNPVVLMPGVLAERGADLVSEFTTSVLMGTGQFCTNPGLLILQAGTATEEFLEGTRQKFVDAQPGTLLSSGVKEALVNAVQTLTNAGATLLCGGRPVENQCSVSNSLLRVSAKDFLRDPEIFQTEAFGNASLAVVADSVEEIGKVVDALEGNLTGCIYSSSDATDAASYQLVAPKLARRVGRLLNDKMPTGVAVSPAMNHGGPFPATGHPGFTAVGIPASLFRFAKLTCYDAVREDRLPALLRDKNPTGKTWRSIDLNWTVADVS